MLKDLKIAEFLNELASNSPSPGGGSVAALNAALGAALISMVCNLSIDKKECEQHKERLIELLDRAQKAQQSFMEYIDKDANAFNGYMEARKLSKDTPELLQFRKNKMDEALMNAALVPLELAALATNLMYELPDLLKICNQNAYSDALVAAVNLRTAVYSAIFNVTINLESIKDPTFIQQTTKQAQTLYTQATTLEFQILGNA